MEIKHIKDNKFEILIETNEELDALVSYAVHDILRKKIMEEKEKNDKQMD